MNRAQRLEQILLSHGGSATLGQILEAVRWDGGLAYKTTAAISELREELQRRSPSKTIVWKRGKTPSEGVYSIVELVDHDQRLLRFA